MSNSESPPTLPVELIEMIMEHIHPKDARTNHYLYREVKRDLLACILVSWTWCTVARRYLFREVEWSFAQLDGPEGGIALSNRHQRTFSMMCKFLKNSLAIAQCIRKLTLRHKRYFGFLTPVPEYGDFLSFLNLIPYLQELNLTDVAICHQDGAMYPANHRSLTKLNISYHTDFKPGRLPGTYATSAGLQALIACAGKIEELNLTGLNMLAWSVEVSSPPSTHTGSRLFEPAIVTSVTLGPVHDDEKALASLFAGCIRADTLRSMTLGDAELRLYDALLLSVGPHLERLRVFSGSCESHGDFTVIRHCPNLRELVFNVMLDGEDYELESELRSLLDLLKHSQIGSSHYPNISALALCVHPGYYSGDFTHESLSEELDATLMSIITNTAIPAISIRWPQESEYGRGECETYVKRILPTLSTSGMLRFGGIEL